MSGPTFCRFNKEPRCMFYRKWSEMYLDYRFWVLIILTAFAHIFTLLTPNGRHVAGHPKICVCHMLDP